MTTSQKVESVKKVLKDNSRFYVFETKENKWIYDSVKFQLYSISNSLFNELNNVQHDLSSMDFSELLEFQIFLKEIEEDVKEDTNYKLESNMCVAMISLGNNCNLNCSYCYRKKTENQTVNIEHVRNAIKFILTGYKKKPSNYIFTFSMNSESSRDLPLLKQILDDYKNYEPYYYTLNEIPDNTALFSKKINEVLLKNRIINAPVPENITKEQIVSLLNKVISIPVLPYILGFTRAMYEEKDRSEFDKYRFLADYRKIRLNRWTLDILFDPFIKRKSVPFVSFSVMTNGTCASKEYMDFLKSVDINYICVSIDGPEEVHNHSRFYKDNTGSYKDIVNNLKIFKENGFTFRASTVLTAFYPKPLEVAQHLKSLGFVNVSMLPVRSNQKDSFTKENINALLTGYDELFEQLKKDLLNGNFELFSFLRRDMSLSALYYFLERKKNVRRCPFDDQLVINSDGSITSCLYMEGIDDYCIGNIKDGITKEITHNITTNYRKPCADCWAKHLCGGTCFYNSYLSNNDILPADEIECIIKKHLIKHCLSLLAFAFENNISIQSLRQV